MEKLKINKKILFIAIILVVLLTLLNTKVYATEETPFKLTSETIDVKLNGTGYISYSGGTGTLTWESSDPSIATVESGTITGKKIGTTTITATRGTETATCTVNVVYGQITIGANEGKSASKVNLFLGEHTTENLTAKVYDRTCTTEVENATVTWTSSDSTIVKVDSKTGTITAVKPGTATITATAAGVTDTCEVTVYEETEYTDFSNAKFETTLNNTIENLKITGITPINNYKTNYYCIITSDNTKPTITKRTSGAIDIETLQKNNNIEYLSINTEENYMYTRAISKYAELNQDIYIWIIQQNSLQDSYYDNSGNYVYYATKFIVEGKKVERVELPKLNLILQGFSISNYDSTSSEYKSQYTYMYFNFPTDTKNRKFNLKIGKITDTSILNKIKNNDYSGITELLEYAKKHDAVYNETLTTTSEGYFSSEKALFDGNKLLVDDAYYFIYVEFDDENGKYYPIEGVTLAQAWLSSFSNSWNLWAYTSDDFEWNNLTATTTTPTETKAETKAETKDDTQSPSPIPQAGKMSILIIAIVAVVIMVVTKRKIKNIGF